MSITIMAALEELELTLAHGLEVAVYRDPLDSHTVIKVSGRHDVTGDDGVVVSSSKLVSDRELVDAVWHDLPYAAALRKAREEVLSIVRGGGD